ncbi:hypothetical protein [Poritiphilus flavus]|uniref:Uncharacterized protein n=1 Tax=Poritiphilus flavus TaxID=2697053 RepID=A0A6L9E8F2_9FLAO|nr:hypothetical protein [Poritiphilus flavus]NAS11057.1 hypothetical protein [Poritiphilus flavus]
MKFNWISTAEADDTLKKRCIELEYQLRPKITRFLMARLEQECCGDFSCFYFDVNLETRQISIANKTPVRYTRRIAFDFDREINQQSLVHSDK